MGETTARGYQQLAGDYKSVWNEGTFTKLSEVITRTSYYDPGVPDGEIHGRDAFETFLRELLEGFPNIHITIDTQVATEEGIIEEWTMTGTHKGGFNGIPLTQREVKVKGMSKKVFTDGRMQEHHVYYDPQELVEQLGLSFPIVLGHLPKLGWRKPKARV